MDMSSQSMVVPVLFKSIDGLNTYTLYINLNESLIDCLQHITEKLSPSIVLYYGEELIITQTENSINILEYDSNYSFLYYCDSSKYPCFYYRISSRIEPTIRNLSVEDLIQENILEDEINLNGSPETIGWAIDGNPEWL